MTEITLSPSAAFFQEETGEMYYADQGALYQYLAGSSFIPSCYQSRVITTRTPVAIQAAFLRFEFKGGAIPSSAIESSIAQAIADLDDAIDDLEFFDSGAVSGHAIGSYSISGGPYIAAVSDAGSSPASLVFKLYSWDRSANSGLGEWVLRHTEQVIQQGAFRMPGGYTSDQFYYELTFLAADISEVIIAETLSDLDEVPRA